MIQLFNYGENAVRTLERQLQGRITAEAPEMYGLLKNIAFYINEINKLRPLPSELITYARRAEALLERIGGER